MDDKNISLICPKCHTTLQSRDRTFHCNNCNLNYPVKEDIVCLLDKNDTFYEGSYEATINFTCQNEGSLKSLLYLYFINNHYLWYIKKYVNQFSKILDIACGGGIRYLAQKGSVSGIDKSFSSLRKTTEFYDLSVQADALNIPFPDSSYDIVASCYAFEHFSLIQKHRLLGEFHRVLKPGGKIVMLFDCDNNNPLFRWFKKYPDHYSKHFIEQDHHYGLQLPSANIKLIHDEGFRILEQRSFNKTPLQHLPVYGWMSAYGEKSRVAGMISTLASHIRKYRVTNLTYQAFVTVLDDIMERLLPLDWARLLLVVAVKV